MPLKFSRALLFLSACCSGIAYGVGVAQGNAQLLKADPAFSSVIVCARFFDGEDSEDSRYVVNLADNRLESETKRENSPNQSSSCFPSGHDKKARVAATRLLGKVTAQHAKNPGKNQLVYDAVNDIQSSLASGDTPDMHVRFSPDGAYAVLITDYGTKLFLVRVATLETTILANTNSHVESPVAWSPDSRFVAVAPHGTGALQIYSIAKRAVVSKISGTGHRVVSLSWSPDSKYIAAFELHHRRMEIWPWSLIAALAGHPIFKNDGVLGLYQPASSQRSSKMLMWGISEMGQLAVAFQWK